MRLWLIRGGCAPGADEDQRAGEVELVERRFGGLGLARALERHDEGLIDAWPIGRGPSVVGGHGARSRPRAIARSRRLAAGSETVMSVTPRLRSTARMSRPTGPPPVTSTRSPGSTPARSTACRAMAVGSVSAASRVLRPSGRTTSRAASQST